MPVETIRHLTGMAYDNRHGAPAVRPCGETLVWRAAIGALLTICGLIAGCTTNPVSLDPQFSLELREAMAENPCRLNLVGVRDARKTTDLGQVAGRKVESGEILEWLANGLEQTGIGPQPDDDLSRPTFDVEIVLLAAHARSVETSMCCDVVLDAVFKQKQETVASRRCRGSCTRINWVSGTDEIDRCFDLALQAALVKLHEQALSVCDDAPRGTSSVQ